MLRGGAPIRAAFSFCGDELLAVTRIYFKNVKLFFPSGILVQARKTVKQETKALLDEMEEALEKAHLKCLEDHNAHVR